MHVKKNDRVVVLTGKSKGETGTVLSVDRKALRAIVERVNMMKKHAKADPKKGVQAGILSREAPIPISNLMIVCPKCSKPSRMTVVRGDDGHRTRQCRRDGCRARIDK